MASPLDPQGKDREGLPASRLVRVVLLLMALHRPVGVLADRRRPVGRADLHLPADHRLQGALEGLVDHLRPSVLADPVGLRSTAPAFRWAGRPARASCR